MNESEDDINTLFLRIVQKNSTVGIILAGKILKKVVPQEAWWCRKGE